VAIGQYCFLFLLPQVIQTGHNRNIGLSGMDKKRTGDITKDPPFFQPSVWALIVYPAMGDSTRTIAGQHPAGNHMMDLDDGMGHHTLG
jgi:hypothetical protein